jgi:hypothetical protein
MFAPNYSSSREGVVDHGMSLRPRALDFDEVWGRLMETCVRVLTLRKVEKNVWSDRFT